ncbi:MAG: cupin domain-containing protein [Paracoccaceae bacterium]
MGLAEQRTIAKIGSAPFEIMDGQGPRPSNTWWHNISFDSETGKGSYFMIMPPGSRSEPHTHLGREEFFVLEGELVDVDGQVYVSGDFVSLDAGSSHGVISSSGCKLIVTHHGATQALTPLAWEAMQ